MILQLDVVGCGPGPARGAAMFMRRDAAEDEESEGEDTIIREPVSLAHSSTLIRWFIQCIQ